MSERFTPKGLFAALRGSLLCRRDNPITSAWQAIGWWEARRIPFNLIVGSAGILSCIVVTLVKLERHILFGLGFRQGDDPIFILFVILVYVAAANVFYTGGWLFELIVRNLWPNQADRFSTLTFSLGLIFAAFLTLVPASLFGGAGVFGLIGEFFGVIHEHWHTFMS